MGSMDAREFVSDLETVRDDLVRRLAGAGRESLGGDGTPRPGDLTKLLQIALANEINVSELAAAWVPATAEVDIKIALARPAGDEARHFELVAGRLQALGFDPERFVPPGPSPLFGYLRSLETSVERVAAGLFTLESIAYSVNQRFMQVCALRGDQETARIYRDHIQPDEQAHRDLGSALREKYATDDGSQARARAAVLRTLEIAGAQRAKAAERLGTACLPGC